MTDPLPVINEPPSSLCSRGSAAERSARCGDARPRGRGRRSGARGSITLERPRRAELGDYSTNAALLLAPALGCAPREVAERLGEELRPALGASLERFEVAGSGLPQPVHGRLLADRRRLRECSRPAMRFGAGLGAGARAHARRVRVRQPDRADARRPRPQRRLRRRACSHSGLSRPRRRSASSMSTTPGRRCASSASRSARWRAARRWPRTATRATTSQRLGGEPRERRDSTTRPSWAARPSR